MGCDIHLYTERKRSVKGKTQWVNVDYWKKNPYYGDDEYEREYELIPAYRHRNYFLFSILADVRNYSNNIPISKPKGLPEDVSDEVRAESERWGSDGHSHSYFTLLELKDHIRLVPPAVDEGYILKEDAKLLDEKGEIPVTSFIEKPNSENYVWKKWVIPNPLEDLIKELKIRYCKEFHLWKYRPGYEEDFRIVFWFDN